MVANALHHIPGIPQEQFVVIRFRSVDRVCQPEVLPDHNSVFVAENMDSDRSKPGSLLVCHKESFQERNP